MANFRKFLLRDNSIVCHAEYDGIMKRILVLQLGESIDSLRETRDYCLLLKKKKQPIEVISRNFAPVRGHGRQRLPATNVSHFSHTQKLKNEKRSKY